MPRRKRKPQATSGVQETNARYDAAGTGRRMASWRPPSSGPNRALEGLTRIRDRARDATRNDWAGASGVQKWTTALVGVGITPRWEDEALGPIFEKWSPSADADGALDFFGLQTLAVRSWLDSGECFARRRPRNPATSPLNVPLQLQLIEADYCPVFDALVWPGMPQGNEIRQGIERNRFGERVAYWMFKEHPGDGYRFGGAPNPADMIRVPARDVIHLYEPLRPGQLRGVSMLAAVLVKLRNQGDFEDTVLNRQLLANLFTLFITRQMPDPFWEDVETGKDGLPTAWGSGAVATLGSGTTQELMPGEDVKYANPPEAGTTFSDYMRTSNMGTAAGAGLPYELFAGDLKDISDRTLRVAINEFRRFAEARQWQVVIHQFCRTAIEWWAQAAVLTGEVPAGRYEEAARPTWQPHGWPDIHPTQDIEGRIAARDAGFTSTSAVIARTGDDPKKVLRERKADEASGLTPKPPEPSAPAPGAKPQPTAVLEDVLASVTALVARPAQPQAPSAAETAVTALLDVVAQQQAQHTQLLQAVASIAQALAERPNVTNVAAPSVNVEAPNVDVAVAAPEVHVAAPNVDVHVPEQAAPVVNVTNDVQPAAVQVDVNLPERETTSLIERNRDGDITKVVQTEKTVQPVTH